MRNVTDYTEPWRGERTVKRKNSEKNIYIRDIRDYLIGKLPGVIKEKETSLVKTSLRGFDSVRVCDES